MQTTASAQAVARRFLEKRGYELLEDARDGGLVAVDPENGNVVFVEARLGESPAGGFPAERTGSRRRAERELSAGVYLAEHPEVEDARVRFDVVSAVRIAGGRYFIKHHVDALGSD